MWARDLGVLNAYFEARERRAIQQTTFEVVRDNQKWAAEILKGGYILHIRHAQRARWHDAAAFDAWEARNQLDASQESWSAATCLTARGVEEAKMLGDVFRAAGMEIGNVYSSPVCRARQTAEYAFGTGFEVRRELLASTALWPQERGDFALALREMLQNVPIEEGKNTIMTGHGSTFNSGQVAVFDVNEMRQGQPRNETGFYVIERQGDALIARHRFASMRDFANAVFRMPKPGS
ncbi:MAG: histidine phosphatase family protein [Pseudomonadota bacterium]